MDYNYKIGHSKKAPNLENQGYFVTFWNNKIKEKGLNNIIMALKAFGMALKLPPSFKNTLKVNIYLYFNSLIIFLSILKHRYNWLLFYWHHSCIMIFFRI